MNSSLDLSSLRENYTKGELDLSTVESSPFLQFKKWFTEAVSSQLTEPNAMFLSTVSVSGQPSGRVVLLKEADDRGFVWYTNYQSKKGMDLEASPKAAITFFWAELERQVRIEGTVEKVSAEESDAYFSVRPRGSQIGAWASPQSSEISDRSVLEANEFRLREQFSNQPIPRPDHWGGYRLIPHQVEFWQGRPSRLHDRILYVSEENDSWSLHRLAP